MLLLISNEFSYKAENWSGKTVKGKLVKYKKQWHLNSSSELTTKLFVLGVLQVEGAGVAANKLTEISAGNYKIGDWELNVNLDTSKNARLTLYNTKTTSVFNVGTDTFETNNKKQRSGNCDGYYEVILTFFDKKIRVVDICVEKHKNTTLCTKY